ncbi:MAG: DNA double-strand break repair nuclease NurA [Methanomicrobiales archaeon]|nr:DNA double-strand break repair nuclease NurA [Methanomicrobiales archaeon]
MFDQMLDIVYERGVGSRERISGLVRVLEKSCPDASELWRSDDIPRWEHEIRIAAVDGSYNRLDFRNFVLFAIDAESVMYEGDGIRNRQEAVVDLLRPYRYAKNRLQLYMTLLEMRLAYLTLEVERPDRLLFDGSLYGHAIRPMPFEREISEETRSRVMEDYLPELQAAIESNRAMITSFLFFDGMQKDFRDEFAEAASYLEYLERLLVLSMLLNRYRNSLIGISKTAQRTDFFNAEVPDMAIFERSTKGAGWSIPVRLPLQREAKRGFPILDDFYRGLDFMTCYARLEDGANMLRLEFPYAIDEREIVRNLSLLRETSAGGYPYLLRRAHRDVVIGHQDMERLAHLFGLFGRTGREML